MKERKFDNKSLCSYFESLVPRVFKILPIYEEGYPTLKTYTQRLDLELCGFDQLIEECENQPDFVGLLAVIHFISNSITDIDHDSLKSAVMSGIKHLNNLRDIYTALDIDSMCENKEKGA